LSNDIYTPQNQLFAVRIANLTKVIHHPIKYANMKIRFFSNLPGEKENHILVSGKQ